VHKRLYLHPLNLKTLLPELQTLSMVANAGAVAAVFISIEISGTPAIKTWLPCPRLAPKPNIDVQGTAA
jgi:hypothetical protein